MRPTTEYEALCRILATLSEIASHLRAMRQEADVAVAAQRALHDRLPECQPCQWETAHGHIGSRVGCCEETA